MGSLVFLSVTFLADRSWIETNLGPIGSKHSRKGVGRKRQTKMLKLSQPNFLHSLEDIGAMSPKRGKHK